MFYIYTDTNKIVGNIGETEMLMISKHPSFKTELDADRKVLVSTEDNFIAIGTGINLAFFEGYYIKQK